MYKRLISSALIFGAAALAPPAQAQMAFCSPRAVLVQSLESRYQEQLTGIGQIGQQELIEVWSNAATGSFTVFVTHANGLSCVISGGQDWQAFDPVPLEGVAG